MKRSIRPFENAFTVISLILFSQGFFPIIIGGNSFQEKGDVDSVLLRVVFLIIYSLTFALLAFRKRVTLTFLKTNIWVLFLIGLASASVFWSSVPDIALRKIVSLIGTSLFGLYLGSRYSFEEQLKLYGWVYGISVTCSLLFALFWPAQGVMNTISIQGAWRGIYPHKNGLGQSMFASFLTFYFLSIFNSKKKLLFYAYCFLSIVLIYFGESATSLISVVFIFAVAQGLNKLSLKSKRSVFLILLFLILVSFCLFLLIANFTAFLSANDKDITLSGRTILWDSLWDFIQEKPWLGYGYESFFSGRSREASLLWQAHDWSPVHSHNGYVHLAVNLGFVSLAIFSVGYFGCWFNSLYKYLISKNIKMLWIFLFLTYTIFFNFTEVSFMSTNNNIWIMSLASIYSLKITATRK